MARNDEEEIVLLEGKASQLGYSILETIHGLDIATAERLAASQSELMGLGNQFRWIASHLMPATMSTLTPVERKRIDRK